MKTIYKYPLVLDDIQIVPLPRDAHLLTVQEQQGSLMLWASVDTDAREVEQTIYIVGTGQPLQEYHQHYLATIQFDGFVWHVFTSGI